MKFYEYNEKTDIPNELYEKTLTGVKSAIFKHNQVQKRRKTVLISAVTCFVILVCSVSSLKYFSKNPADDILKITDRTPIEKSNSDSSIKIITENPKYPVKILIDNKIYSQYYFGDGKGDKNNNIELKQSEISELICEIDCINLTEDLEDFAPMTFEEAKDNKFYKAKAYKYTNSKSENIIIVKANDEYYLFYLDGLTTDYTVEELLNVYTANGINEIAEIEIWQDEFYELKFETPQEDIESTEVRPLQKGTIRNREAINSILAILNNEHSNLNGHNNYLNEYDKAFNKYYDSGLINDYPLMSKYGVYELRIIFADGSELLPDTISLNVVVNNDSLRFCICTKGNEAKYSLNKSEYDKLTEIINTVR